MAMTMETAARAAELTGYTATPEDERSLTDWFARYDALAERADVEALADMAVFPMNTVTDDGAGNGSAAQSDRAAYVRSMAEVMGPIAGKVRFTSTRTPFFLSGAVVVVFTRSAAEVDGATTEMHYVDVLVKADGEWRFQTMVQAGWGSEAMG
ncbi:nuclear transport factor 2 family protein [Nocardiopsis trehalosi]|uniref:nuclear transport factor 2 family protein n=1 Tax=Nocardiopsis trehalosi TaxID=109329 RepID=UPI000B0E3F32|nr:nuclear transport factor 2 family protein [Nocardiopsis trehalosi]